MEDTSFIDQLRINEFKTWLSEFIIIRFEFWWSFVLWDGWLGRGAFIVLLNDISSPEAPWLNHPAQWTKVYQNHPSVLQIFTIVTFFQNRHSIDKVHLRKKCIIGELNCIRKQYKKRVTNYWIDISANISIFHQQQHLEKKQNPKLFKNSLENSKQLIMPKY